MKLELTTNRSTQRRVKSTEGEGRDGHRGSEGKTRKATETWSCRIEEREIMSLSPPTKQAMSRPKLPQTPTHHHPLPRPVSVLLLSCCHHVSI